MCLLEGIASLHAKTVYFIYLKKIWGFYCFLFALLGRSKKNDGENGGEHFLSPTLS
jgi:hypothetical protein